MDKNTISSYATKLLLSYASSCGLDSQYVLSQISTIATKLLSDTRWISFEEWNQIQSFVGKKLYVDNYTLGYNATMEQYRHSTKQTRILKVLPMIALKKFLPYIMTSYINKNLNCTLTEESGNLIFRISPVDITQYSRELCDYNKGSCAAIINMRMNRSDIVVEEMSCVLCGDLSCTYSMSMTGKRDPIKHTAVEISAEDIDRLFEE